MNILRASLCLAFAVTTSVTVATAQDHQLASAENLPALRDALVGNVDVTVVPLPGINHMFQITKTGAVGEYADIAGTFAPVAMESIANWTQKRFQES